MIYYTLCGVRCQRRDAPWRALKNIKMRGKFWPATILLYKSPAPLSTMSKPLRLKLQFFIHVHKNASQKSWILRIEKRRPVCYISIRKGESDVQIRHPTQEVIRVWRCKIKIRRRTEAHKSAPLRGKKNKYLCLVNVSRWHAALHSNESEVTRMLDTKNSQR